jgi:hypothetical protein
LTRLPNASRKITVNIELVQSDAATYRFRSGGRPLSTFAITLMPEYDRIIKTAEASPRKENVILDFKKPTIGQHG